MKAKLLAALAIVNLIGVACDPALTPPDSPASGGGVQAVGVGLAMALRDEQARLQMIDEMRRSPWVEHKLSLSEALSGQENHLRFLAADALDTSEESLLRWIEQLPDMDFYVLDRSDRRNWTGDGAVAVAASADGERVALYDGTGEEVESAENAVKFALHPAETRAYRVGRPETFYPGRVIEDPADGAGGFEIEYTSPRGDLVIIDAGAMQLTPDEAVRIAHQDLGLERRLATGNNRIEAEGDAPSASGFTTSYVMFFQNINVDDGALGSAEIELKAWQYNGRKSEEVKFRWTGVDKGHTLVADRRSGRSCGSHPDCSSLGLTLWWWITTGSELVWVEMWETDTWGDNLYGTVTWSEAQSADTKLIGPTNCDGEACGIGQVVH